MKEDPVHVFIHLFKPDLLVPEHLADENPALVPADISAVIDSPSLKRSGIDEARYSAGQQASAGHIDASRRFVGQSFVGALIG
jgi:hypothetical protein